MVSLVVGGAVQDSLPKHDLDLADGKSLRNGKRVCNVYGITRMAPGVMVIILAVLALVVAAEA